MYSIYSCVAVGIVVALFVYAYNRDGFWGHILVGGFFGAVAGVVLCVTLLAHYPSANWEVCRHKLASVRSADGMQEVFFFRNVDSTGEEVYVLLKGTDAQFSQFSLNNARSTRIMEDETLLDEGVLTIRAYGQDPNSFLAGWALYKEPSRTYTIRVPKGALQNSVLMQ